MHKGLVRIMVLFKTAYRGMEVTTLEDRRDETWTRMNANIDVVLRTLCVILDC